MTAYQGYGRVAGADLRKRPQAVSAVARPAALTWPVTCYARRATIRHPLAPWEVLAWR
jgi:hypothetical protein